MQTSSNDVGPSIQLSNGFVVPRQVMCHATSLRKASRRITQLYDVVLAPCGLRSTQRSIMMQIGRGTTPAMSELAAALVLDRSALAHNLKPLERDGYVRVAVDPQDKRSRLVTLTAQGENKLADSQRLWEQAQVSFESALGPEQANEMRESLRLISAASYPQVLEQVGRAVPAPVPA
ncbi:MarR family winged helix-turn-helix transcriptional regulator [Pseudomonas sp. NA-150]|uniref:MarR family winged helix-turn-helix transcriptional regulator n=1 Tax=Pseudomonas sp. NA-150 TaxID=3367525 RepID=UPI0037C72E5E